MKDKIIPFDCTASWPSLYNKEKVDPTESRPNTFHYSCGSCPDCENDLTLSGGCPTCIFCGFSKCT